MTHGAHPPEPPEHGTVHVHDDHGHGAHGHGAELGFPIIPENSAADGILKLLAVAALLGWFAFAGIMMTAPPHHGTEHSGSQEHQAAPGEHVQPQPGLTEPSTDKGAPPGEHGAAPAESGTTAAPATH